MRRDLISMRRAADFCLRFRLHRRTSSAGIYRTALVIGADSMSHMVDWSDSSTCILFGDGAGAVVLRAESKGGLFVQAAHSDGSKRSCSDRMQPAQKKLGCIRDGSKGSVHSDGRTKRI